MNLREALKRAEDLGCQVDHVYRTGELRIKAPDRPRTVKVNSRRKDCPRSLQTVVNQLRRKRDQSTGENSQHGRSPAGSGGHQGLLLQEGSVRPEETRQDDIAGPESAVQHQCEHPPCPPEGVGLTLPKPLKIEMSEKDKKRFERQLVIAKEQFRRYKDLYEKESRIDQKTPDPEKHPDWNSSYWKPLIQAKMEARRKRMADAALKIMDWSNKEEAIKAILEGSHA